MMTLSTYYSKITHLCSDHTDIFSFTLVIPPMVAMGVPFPATLEITGEHFGETLGLGGGADGNIFTLDVVPDNPATPGVDEGQDSGPLPILFPPLEFPSDYIEALYGRPHFTAEERLQYFCLSQPEKDLLGKLRSVKSQAYFILQLGYFKARHLFFTFEYC